MGGVTYQIFSILRAKKNEVVGGIRLTERAPSGNLSRALCPTTADFLNQPKTTNLK